MQDILKQLRENWVIWAFLTSAVIWYANINHRLADAEEKITQQEKVVESINQINLDVAVIKTQVVDINKKLDR